MLIDIVFFDVDVGRVRLVASDIIPLQSL